MVLIKLYLFNRITIFLTGTNECIIANVVFPPNSTGNFVNISGDIPFSACNVTWKGTI